MVAPISLLVRRGLICYWEVPFTPQITDPQFDPKRGAAMLISMKSVLLVVVGLLVIRPMVAAQEKPRLAVLNFANRGSVEEADAIAEELRVAFVKSGKYTVVDRT